MPESLAGLVSIPVPPSDSYRKESERLLLWSTIELGKPLSSLTHEGSVGSSALSPVTAAGRSAGFHEDRSKMVAVRPEWRPFADPLAATSQHSDHHPEYDVFLGR